MVNSVNSNSKLSGGVLPKLTNKEQEVLRMITEEHATPKEITLRRKTKNGITYKIIRSLIKKGHLEKNWVRKRGEKLEYIVANDQYCYFCDIDEALHTHHIVQRKHGGGNEMENLLVVCANCHWKIHHNYYLEFSNGYYYMRHPKKNIVIPPSDRQLKSTRVLPRKSLSKAISSGKLRCSQ